MDEFIRAQVRELRRTPNVRLPKPAECMIVTKLAKHSLAGYAGVSLKDLLVSLDSTLARLGPGQLLAVCLLASYRGNGPYDDFMRRYLHYATWFSRFLPGLHVVTMEKERYPDRPHYFEAEDEVRGASLPLELLLEDGQLSATVRQTGSPFIVLLDRSRRVRYEGELASVDLWDTLAALSAEPA
jgi:hypothetical protein